jgi:hypothetical protein
MGVSNFHIFRQGPMIATLARIATRTITQSLFSQTDTPLKLPGPVLTKHVPPRSPELIKDYIKHVGGDPALYSGSLPPHLFPQWGIPILTQTIPSNKYDISRILNGGVKYCVEKNLPANEPLKLKAQLMDIDDNGRRIIFTQRLVTETTSAPNALIAEVKAVLPSKKNAADNKSKREKPRVHDDAHEIGRIALSRDDGLNFARLTGDFNPIHWVRFYARISGFSDMILHGFSTMARAAETLIRNRFSGQTGLLKMFDVSFVRPLVLPNSVSVFILQDQIWVGHAAGGAAYITGRFG